MKLLPLKVKLLPYKGETFTLKDDLFNLLLLIKSDTTLYHFTLRSYTDKMTSAMDVQIARIQKRLEAKTANKNKVEEEGRNLADNSVTKSNALSRAYYRFSIGEKRVMEALISRLHPMRSDNDLQDIKLTAVDYAKTYSIDSSNSYSELSSAVDGLVSKVIQTAQEGERVKKNPLMVEANYMPREGLIVCTLNPRIVPHLIGLRAKFSSYPLASAVNFKSSYTWRFYEILVSWAQPKAETDGRFMGWFDVETDELRKMLGVPDSYNYGRFRKSVLERVTTELFDKANIILKLEPKKTSRRITSYKVTFMENDQLKLL